MRTKTYRATRRNQARDAKSTTMLKFRQPPRFGRHRKRGLVVPRAREGTPG